MENSTSKKIAIFHQFLDNIGGAELVTLTLARELNADVYTTNISEEKIKKTGFEDVLPRVHSIGKIPIKAPYRHQAALWRFSKLKLKDKYDFFIISGDWAVSGAKHNKPNLWYVHSPCRELWDLRKHVRKNMVPWYARPIFDLWSLYNRRIHKKYIENVEKFACNSKNTQKRVKKYLKKDARVINPPTNTKRYYYKEPKGYWLSVNRLLEHKRIEIQLEAFSKMPSKKLIIVGSYEKNTRQFEEYKEKLESIKPKNVEIKHWISDKELKNLYAESIGTTSTAKDEDFGMSPVESMASGKPVIASNEGGHKETIIHGKTGELIDNIDGEKLADAIKRWSKKLSKKENRELFRKNCQKRAKKFDTDKFIEKIKREIKKEGKKWG